MGSFMETIFADRTVSVTEVKRNLAAVINETVNEATAILNYNKPAAYLLVGGSL
jgi:antitoxin StbD